MLRLVNGVISTALSAARLKRVASSVNSSAAKTSAAAIAVAWETMTGLVAVGEGKVVGVEEAVGVRVGLVVGSGVQVKVAVGKGVGVVV